MAFIFATLELCLSFINTSLQFLVSIWHNISIMLIPYSIVFRFQLAKECDKEFFNA